MKYKTHARKQKRAQIQSNLQQLASDVQNLDTSQSFSQFSELPLSQETQQGLKVSYYYRMTDIQAKSLPLSLKGNDVLAAARTGSGKTLAFLVPLLEKLMQASWTPNDGLGALVISPTRELAMQIFEVLRTIGRFHQFSAGLVIGGKNLSGERDRLSRMNILVATPGRLLQHLDQTIHFDASNLQILVLDEADRILDMGFKGTLDAIVHHLPASRQTLLFSATQTKSVKDLARLSLSNPKYVSASVDSEASLDAPDKLAMPEKLIQHYAVVNLPDKINLLWSFIKTHLFTKTIVFVSSGKQVRFLYENLRHLRPGVPLLHIHGRQKQTMRYDIYQKFVAAKHAFLFATDVAARGLDFPAVNWVVQLDCPEDVDMYVHRVGRTARYNRHGKALLFLTPSEEPAMLKRFEQKGLSVPKIDINTAKLQSIQSRLQFAAFEYPEMKFLAQKAFISYVRSVFLQKDKEIFDLAHYPLEEFAQSLGLVGAPRVKWMSKQEASARKNITHDVEALKNAQDSDEDERAEDGRSGTAADGHYASDTGSDNANGNSYGRDIGSDSDNDSESVVSEASPQLKSTRRTAKTSDSESDDDVSDFDSGAESSGWDTADSDEEAPNVKPSAARSQESESESDSPSESTASGDESEPQSTEKPTTDKPATKHDRLFGRKNQTILSDHYNKLVDQNESDEDDFMKIVRRNHDIDETALPQSNYTSKRQQKLALSKKNLAAKGPRPTKLRFDDEGDAEEVTNFADEKTFDTDKAEALREQFVAREREALEQSDSRDKLVAREKRRQKKLKQKMQDRDHDDQGQDAVAELDEPSDDDGYVSPDFDLPPESDSEDSEEPQRKKSKPAPASNTEDMEALALKFLQH